VLVRSGEPPRYRVINKPLLSQNMDTDRLRGPEQARRSSAGTTGSGLESCDGLRVAAMYSVRFQAKVHGLLGLTKLSN